MNTQGFRNIVPIIGSFLDYPDYMRLRHTCALLFQHLRRHADIHRWTHRSPKLVERYFARDLARFIQVARLTMFGYEEGYHTFTVCKIHIRTGIICDLLGVPRSDIFRDDFMHCFDDRRRMRCMRSLSNEERSEVGVYWTWIKY